MSKATGGPAFPTMHDARYGPLWNTDVGMTLRDYFAAKALQGLLACPEVRGKVWEFVELAYQYADAMLKARKE